MKLRMYYGKEKKFDSIDCVKKRENSHRKNSYLFNLWSAAFIMIVFFTLVVAPPCLSSQWFKYGKTIFIISGTLGWNRSNTFQRKIATTKQVCFFFKIDRGNWCGRKQSWVIVWRLSNKFFPFVQICQQLYLYFG